MDNVNFSLPFRKPLIATVEKQLLGEHLTATLQKGTHSSHEHVQQWVNVQDGSEWRLMGS